MQRWHCFYFKVGRISERLQDGNIVLRSLNTLSDSIRTPYSLWLIVEHQPGNRQQADLEVFKKFLWKKKRSPGSGRLIRLCLSVDRSTSERLLACILYSLCTMVQCQFT